MSEEKLIKWEILDAGDSDKKAGVLAVAVFNPQGGDWCAYIGAYFGKSHQNEAAKVSKVGTKLDRQVAGLIFSGVVGQLNRERMTAGAASYLWRE